MSKIFYQKTVIANPKSAKASGVIITDTPETKIAKPKAPKITREGPITAEREFVLGLVIMMSKKDRVWLIEQICAHCGTKLIEGDTMHTDNREFCVDCWNNLYGDTEVDINIPIE